MISPASYVLRWQQRPTPFGLFAGVARSPMMSHHMSTLRDTNVSTAGKAAQADALREPMITELREMASK